MNQNPPPHPNAFRLHEYLVEPSLNRITGPEGAVQVEPRIMAVLMALAARPGEVRSRNDLLDAVWHDTIVNEETLTRAVFHLRRHLGDESGAPRYIETIRKGGYRLVCPVVDVGSEEPATPWRPEVEGPASGWGQGGGGPVPPPAAPRRKGPVLDAGNLPLAPAALVVLIVSVVVVLRFAGPWQGGAPPPSGPAPVVSFTSYLGQELDPSISPDGSLVAFTWRQASDEPFDLYVKHLDAEVPLRLTAGAEREGKSTWSPAGSEVAYHRSGPGGHGIYVVPAIGGPSRLLTETRSEVEGLAWSPDGGRVAFSDRPGEGASFVVRVLDLGSGSVSDLTSPPDFSAGDTRPAYSPDGSRLAFVRGDPARNEDIWVMPAEGGEAARLTQDQLKVRGLTWDPDGEHLVFSGFANGTYSLWRLNIRTGNRSWLAIPGEWAFDPVMASRDGTLVYVDNRFEKNIWRVRLGESDQASQSYGALISSTRWDSEPQYSPDGTRIAFTSSRGGSLEIWLAGADGQDPLRLTRFGGPFVGNPRWSPDGRSLVFFATSEGFAAVYGIDLAGGRPRRLTSPVANALPTSWSRDGKWVYYASDLEDGWQVWKMHADGTEAGRVTRSGGRSAREDGGGRWLYVVRPDRPGLWRLPAGEVEGEGGLEVVMHDLPTAPGYENWFLQGQKFYSLVPGVGAPLALSVDLESWAVDSLAAVPGIASPSLAVSPDGSFLLYSRIDRNESDLRLVRRPVWQGGRGWEESR